MMPAEVNGARLLIVDDEEQIRRSLSRLLERAGHDCTTAAGAVEAMELIDAQEYDLVLTDVNLIGESGLWLARHVLEAHPDTAVVMVTGVDDTNLAKVALEIGAYGYVIKPFEANEIIINVVNALRRRALERDNRSHREHLSQLVQKRTSALEATLDQLAEADKALRRSHEEAIRRLAYAAEFHDPTTGVHLKRMSLYSDALAASIGFDDARCELIRMASPMHDVGKIGIPDDILRKPGRLSPEELTVMRNHPQIGHDLLADSDSDLLDIGAVIALTHHERFDGTGYPNGLVGDDIPLEGRIVALADVFDALTSARPYKAAFPFNEAMDMVLDERGKHFDPDLVDAFVSIRGTIKTIGIAHATPPLAGVGSAAG